MTRTIPSRSRAMNLRRSQTTLRSAASRRTPGTARGETTFTRAPAWIRLLSLFSPTRPAPTRRQRLPSSLRNIGNRATIEMLPHSPEDWSPGQKLADGPSAGIRRI